MRRARDFFQFYQTMLAEYAGHLCALMRGHGIDTPFVHNSANPSMNAWFKPLADTLGEPFVLGSDHYYMLNQDSGQNNPTPQHAVSVFTSLETLRVMGMPPTVFELPGGSLSDWPPFTPEDAKAFYLMNIAFGMKGSNFYILTGGPNVRGTGTTTDVYDYGASIGPRGEIRPLYRTQKQVGLFLKGNPWLMEAGQEAGFRLGLDFEQLVADAYGWRTGADLALSPGDAWSFAQRGILSTAFCASLAPTCVDLGDDAWVADRGTPLAVASSAVMGRAIQQRLVRFLRGGGRLLLAPVVPTLDENLEPCTLLADYLGGVKTVRCAAPYSRLSIGGVSNVYKNGDVFYLDGAPGGAQAVGVDEISGRLMAARWQPDGGGDVLVLGFRWSQGKREHEAMLTVLLKGLGLKRVLSSSNPNVWLTLRTAGCRSALFVMNLLSAPQTVRVACRPSWSRRTIDTGLHRLPPMTIRVICLRKR